MTTTSSNKLRLLKFVAVALIVSSIVILPARAKTLEDSTLQNSLCQVVYPLDQDPGTGSYRYMFLGNAFFINEDGYMLTANHLLSWFRDGLQPSLLVGPPEGPRHIVDATIVASDKDHDVAILRIAPSFVRAGNKITYLNLSTETLERGTAVITASLRPADIDNANSAQIPLQDFSHGEVLDYQVLREEGSQGSELLLFNQQVLPGQSGSPLIAAGSHGLVGVVVGRWLHPMVIPSGANGGRLTLSPGAALRTYYAINLLDQLHISWHMAPAIALPQAQDASGGQQARAFTAPVPLSVEGVPYPPLALMGGDVLLDGLVDANGKLTDVRVVKADPPFLEVALTAVRNWSFLPAHLYGAAVESRIGIVFQFPQSYLPRVSSGERRYDEALADLDNRGALPMFTLEPDYPVTSIAEGTVAFYEQIDPAGKITSTTVLRNIDSLTEPTEATLLHQWQFAPGKQAGASTDSAAIVVVTFRRPGL